jgi:hypothetical protein
MMTRGQVDLRILTVYGLKLAWWHGARIHRARLIGEFLRYLTPGGARFVSWGRGRLPHSPPSPCPMVPCILRPGLLHFVLPFTGQHKHQTGQGYKKRSDLALPHAGVVDHSYYRLMKKLFSHSPSSLSRLCSLAIRLASLNSSLNSLIQLLSLPLDITQHSTPANITS